MKVLFIGGGGMIGSAAAAETVAAGHELSVITRTPLRRDLPGSVRHLTADAGDAASLGAALTDDSPDVVVNWVGYHPRQFPAHLDLFRDRIQQYVFISTCSVYARPVPQLPITESSPKRQREFAYAADKLEYEEAVEHAYRRDGFPVTIVRPFHTYDRTRIPLLAGWTAVDRLRRGEPVVVQGDGTSLWSLTHSSDFARGLVPLLGNTHAIGEDVNIVSADMLTWDQIHYAVAAAAGVRDPILVHRSSEHIGRYWPAWDAVLEWDFRHSMIFDNTKLRRLVPGWSPQVPLSRGLEDSVRWFDADPARQVVDEELSSAFDRLIAL